jgi:thiol-disulfide isomerase/thioredoxin
VEPQAAAAPSVVPERELVGLQSWINSEPLTIAGLVSQGRVVLVDFWTYTCINCIRTMPFLRSWHEKYADRGLTILGIHAPEFDFERERDNVIAAVERFMLEYPVAQDNEMVTWRAFENRVWPAKYLIGADGALRYRILGEGAYVQTEQAIRLALTEAGHDVSDIPLGRTDSQARDPDATTQTRELYGGYRWNYAVAPYAAQDEYYVGPDRVALYDDLGVHRDNQWYLQGLWRNEREAIVHARVTEGLEDYIALKFAARSVNVVLRPSAGQPFDVVIELDGRPLAAAEAGADVLFDGDGRSIIRVDDPRLYAIVELPAFGEHELKLRSNSDDFAIFAFTFGVYADGP